MLEITKYRSIVKLSYETMSTYFTRLGRQGKEGNMRLTLLTKLLLYILTPALLGLVTVAGFSFHTAEKAPGFKDSGRYDADCRATAKAVGKHGSRTW